MNDSGGAYLMELAGDSNIVVGTVTALTSQGTFARNDSSVPGPGQRVYSFSVQQVLKGSTTVRSTISVVDFAGATINGVDQHYENRPWLAVGNRYILFLKKGSDDQGSVDMGYVGGIIHPGDPDESHPKLMELTDYSVTDDAQGVIMLVNGTALPNTDGTYTNSPGEFQDYALWNEPEATAIANIQSAVADDASLQTGI